MRASSATEPLSQARAQASKYWVAGLAGVIGIVLSVASFALVRSLDEARVRSELEQQINHQVGLLQQGIDAHLEELHDIRDLFAGSPAAEWGKFRAFVRRHEAHHAAIHALGWVPRVSYTERASFEATARVEGSPAFLIRELNANGDLVEAGPRDEYFPVYFVGSLAGNGLAAGFDLYSDPAQRAALEKARDTGTVVATERVHLAQEADGPFGFRVFLPVYQSEMPRGSVEERRKNLHGFALGVFRIGDLVE